MSKAKPDEIMLAARQAYEADVARKPLYHDGTRRALWAELSEIAQRSWIERIKRSAERGGFV